MTEKVERPDFSEWESPVEGVRDAPVFHPTPEEFDGGALAYIEKIKPIVEQYGICKIIPPAGWKPPFQMPRTQFEFMTRQQTLWEMGAKNRVAMNFIERLHEFHELRGTPIRGDGVWVRGEPLNFYKLREIVVEGEGGEDVVTEQKRWTEVGRRLFGDMMVGNEPSLGAIVRKHYERYISPYEAMVGGKTEDEEQQKKRHTRAQERRMADVNDPNFDGCQICSELDNPETILLCDKCDKGFHMACVDPPLTRVPKGDWFCPGCIKKDFSKTPVAYGFEPGTKYTIRDFQVHADKQKKEILALFGVPRNEALDISCEDMEKVFWKAVQDDTYDVTVEYGADIHCSLYGSGMPMQHRKKPKWYPHSQERWEERCERERKLVAYTELFAANGKPRGGSQENVSSGTNLNNGGTNTLDLKVPIEQWLGQSNAKQEDDLHMDTSILPDAGIVPEGFVEPCSYVNHPFNVNNIAVLRDSLIRYVGHDISGMTIPWLYCGMGFSSFCWHNEDHYSYSINYNHMGSPKTWYGIPGPAAEQFEDALRSLAPELFRDHPDLLQHLVTLASPKELIAQGVPICRTDQHEGEIVLTFPASYHAGFNQGFNVAEASNFTPADWLPWGRKSVKSYRSLHRPAVFSHDQLVLSVVARMLTEHRKHSLIKQEVSDDGVPQLDYYHAASPKITDAPRDLNAFDYRMATFLHEDMTEMIKEMTEDYQHLHSLRGIDMREDGDVLSLHVDDRTCKICKGITYTTLGIRSKPRKRKDENNEEDHSDEEADDARIDSDDEDYPIMVRGGMRSVQRLKRAPSAAKSENSLADLKPMIEEEKLQDMLLREDCQTLCLPCIIQVKEAEHASNEEPVPIIFFEGIEIDKIRRMHSALKHCMTEVKQLHDSTCRGLGLQVLPDSDGQILSTKQMTALHWDDVTSFCKLLPKEWLLPRYVAQGRTILRTWIGEAKKVLGKQQWNNTREFKRALDNVFSHLEKISPIKIPRFNHLASLSVDLTDPLPKYAFELANHVSALEESARVLENIEITTKFWDDLRRPWNDKAVTEVVDAIRDTLRELEPFTFQEEREALRTLEQNNRLRRVVDDIGLMEGCEDILGGDEPIEVSGWDTKAPHVVISLHQQLLDLLGPRHVVVQRLTHCLAVMQSWITEYERILDIEGSNLLAKTDLKGQTLRDTDDKCEAMQQGESEDDLEYAMRVYQAADIPDHPDLHFINLAAEKRKLDRRITDLKVQYESVEKLLKPKGRWDLELQLNLLRELPPHSSAARHMVRTIGPVAEGLLHIKTMFFGNTAEDEDIDYDPKPAGTNPGTKVRGRRASHRGSSKRRKTSSSGNAVATESTEDANEPKAQPEMLRWQSLIKRAASLMSHSTKPVKQLLAWIEPLKADWIRKEQARNEKRGEETNRYCYCDREHKEGVASVQCVQCHCWLHARCTGLRSVEDLDPEDFFVCRHCTRTQRPAYEALRAEVERLNDLSGNGAGMTSAFYDRVVDLLEDCEDWREQAKEALTEHSPHNDPKTCGCVEQTIEPLLTAASGLEVKLPETKDLLAVLEEQEAEDEEEELDDDNDAQEDVIIQTNGLVSRASTTASDTPRDICNGCNREEPPKSKVTKKILWTACAQPTCGAWYHNVCLTDHGHITATKEFYCTDCWRVMQQLHVSNTTRQQMDDIMMIASDEPALPSASLSRPAAARSALRAERMESEPDEKPDGDREAAVEAGRPLSTAARASNAAAAVLSSLFFR
eukprot:Clim_evm17s14 gene=Clim_evmTU17s14